MVASELHGCVSAFKYSFTCCLVWLLREGLLVGSEYAKLQRLQCTEACCKVQILVWWTILTLVASRLLSWIHHTSTGLPCPMKTNSWFISVFAMGNSQCIFVLVICLRLANWMTKGNVNAVQITMLITACTTSTTATYVSSIYSLYNSCPRWAEVKFFTG